MGGAAAGAGGQQYCDSDIDDEIDEVSESELEGL
jgi:hypothetical protein